MKPSKEQMKTALETAQRMRDRGLDPHHVAQVLLYLQRRNQELEQLLVRADRLVRFGMAESELSALRRQIMRLREEDEKSEDDSEIHTSMLL